MPFDAIEKLASALHDPPLQCKANRARYTSGDVWTIMEVEFVNGTVWIVRLRTDHCAEEPSALDDVKRRVECEVATLKLVKDRTNVPVPTVYAYSATAQNDLGFPYIIMSAILGRRPRDIGIDTTGPLSDDYRATFERYCASLARIHLELSRIRFDQFGSVYLAPSDPQGYVVGPIAWAGTRPCGSVADFYAVNVQPLQKGVRAIDGDSTGQRKRAALCLWVYWKAVAACTHPNAPTQSMLVHTDLHMSNTLVNEHGDIVGVFDWDCATLMPAAVFAAQVRMFGGGLWQAPSEERLALFRLYDAALRAAEVEADVPEAERFVADMHASAPCRMMALLQQWAVNGHDFSDSDAMSIFCDHLFGSSDVEALMESSNFETFFEFFDTLGTATKSGP
ncbi:hypothetical protein EXIGLDRAFT_735659 [Exidia glandulosa HHB12029]|uniref:Aminoglycoside phosphotransferase domain-containing protein n=1 Tax=Exidia glandulosa HHB12029 TaxID=1314781 RepID=A0A165PH80_EXIGL|nr:hypothetical protein EXIGLDRAFT_735659 [Exidia glandulosa HHB12029]